MDITPSIQRLIKKCCFLSETEDANGSQGNAVIINLIRNNNSITIIMATIAVLIMLLLLAWRKKKTSRLRGSFLVLSFCYDDAVHF